MKRLSKDATAVLYALYSQFLSRRKVGQPKHDAREFGSSKSIHNDLCPNMCFEDVDEALKELHRASYLMNDYGNDVVILVYLTDEAIVDCENAFADKLISIADFISKIR